MCQQHMHSNIVMQPQPGRGQAPVKLGLLTDGQGLLLVQKPPNEARHSPQSVQKLTINRVTVYYKYFNIH